MADGQFRAPGMWKTGGDSAAGSAAALRGDAAIPHGRWCQGRRLGGFGLIVVIIWR